MIDTIEGCCPMCHAFLSLGPLWDHRLRGGTVSEDKTVPTHPVQTRQPIHDGAKCPQVVTMKAYEVYCALYGEQAALVTGHCRGGMSAGELIAFLYARAFPEKEWPARVDEAFRGMEQL